MEGYILRALQGEQAAFQQLYDQYGGQALRLSMSITQNRQMAEDAVQEAFLRLYRYGHTFQQKEPFAPWFFRIVVNESRRILRREPQTAELPADIPGDASLDEAVTDSVAVEAALSALSAEHRTVLSLKYLLGCSEAEIASVIGKPVGTVKSRLYYGKRALSAVMRGGEPQ